MIPPVEWCYGMSLCTLLLNFYNVVLPHLNSIDFADNLFDFQLTLWVS